MALLQTPQRPLPGAFLQTPAPSRSVVGPVSQPALFKTGTSLSSTQNGASSVQNPPPAKAISPIARAASSINDTLAKESLFPELDNYIGQGVSSDYDIPDAAAWAPFEKSKMFEIPEKIFDQYNRAQVSTIMGLFAELNHAWITIDSSLYLWDYTHVNPELIGFEDQKNTITAVQLTKPRPGVFIDSVTHLLLVATTVDLILVGVSSETNTAGSKTVTLFNTKMSALIRGMDVNTIQGSRKDGRVFFSNRGDNDVYELTYQQEEKWFSNRCGKINHTTRGFSSLTPSIAAAFITKSQEYIVQMAIDSSRDLLYTLSTTSTIRTFHMKPNHGLDLLITKSLSNTFSNIGHMLSSTDLLGPGTRLISINPISAQEASKLHLTATTSTGCRIFFSATASYTWGVGDSSSAPTSMQVQHVKFPPPEMSTKPPRAATGPGHLTSLPTDTRSKSLTNARDAYRFAPGYFVCMKSKTPQGAEDVLFMSAPDSGRIVGMQQDLSQSRKYLESGIWFDLDSRAEDTGLSSTPFNAALKPVGFGNEMAVQFDQTPTEVAVLTNTGIHIIKRRRLVDVFASIARYGENSDGFDTEIRKFITYYGNRETCATALAVTCGQGADGSRGSRVTDPDVANTARRAFIDYGGRPLRIDNVFDQTAVTVDNFKASPRHEGLALYVSRLVRSIWKQPVISEKASPTGGVQVVPVVAPQKLRSIQSDMTRLQEFLVENKTFIDGLSGPDSLQRAANQEEEVALQAEHRALFSLQTLIGNVIEGISFVLVLFDEKVTEIILSLSDTTKAQAKGLTYEGLFTSQLGKDVAKELVKAIVNLNIANGANVDTIAGALRRRCGSFCGADDVTIFKAQELLKRASEAGGNSEFGRNLLNESLKLFSSVSTNLSMEHLEWAVGQYTSMSFFAGAIQLALNVAKNMDAANTALSWITDGRPHEDSRKRLFQSRKACYDLIHKVLDAISNTMRDVPDEIDGHLTLSATRRNEAYSVINDSDDEVFQIDLYDWYRSQGWINRLLEVKSPYIVGYLRRTSEENSENADLLWKYYSQAGKYFDAAGVQLQLAKSDFKIPLERRIEYLSRARANASTHTAGVSRQPRQLLIHEISDLLDVANIQDDIMQRHLNDLRHTAVSRASAVGSLNGPILDLSELYNSYADPAEYFDICLLIYEAADHRNPADIRATWSNLIKATHASALSSNIAPWESVADKVRGMAARLNLSESTFPVSTLIPLLKAYAFEEQNGVGPSSWVMDTLLDVGVAPDAVLTVLESMFYNDEAPFQGRNRRLVSKDIVYVVAKWYEESLKSDRALFGSEATAKSISQMLQMLQSNGIGEAEGGKCAILKDRIDQWLNDH